MSVTCSEFGITPEQEERWSLRKITYNAELTKAIEQLRMAKEDEEDINAALKASEEPDGPDWQDIRTQYGL